MQSYISLKVLIILMTLLLAGALGYLGYKYMHLGPPVPFEAIHDHEHLPSVPDDSIRIWMKTFRGNDRRNFYGDSLPDTLALIWKYEIGTGTTIVKRGIAEKWSGAGWTGQPLLVIEKGVPFLLQGCYDHTLKKINAYTGELVWEYVFDDVLKGTGTLWEDPHPADPANRFLILQGSRLGNKNTLDTDTIPSYRAISYVTGKEVWRLNVKRGPSFSRDVDGSALVWKDTVYMGLENGFFSVFTPGVNDLQPAGDKFFKPLLQEVPMFTNEDKQLHRGELVLEASPAKIGNHIYITSGSGHVYGFNLHEKKIDWDLYIGCDINGSPVVTEDNCLLICLEKQFIPGKGGVMKIDPSKAPEKSIRWFLPTGNRDFSSWKGGIIGTAATNDYAKPAGKNSLASVVALDGFLYLIDPLTIDSLQRIKGPDDKTLYSTPVVLDKAQVGPSISSPVFIGDKILVAGYTGLYLFKINNEKLELIAKFSGGFEATPLAYQGKVFIAGRDGWLYCLGRK